MLPSVAVMVPGRRLPQPIPTMERRDRSSLGRLVMPALDTSGSAVASQSAAQTETGHSRANMHVSDDTQASAERREVRKSATRGSAAVLRPAASQRTSKVVLGVKPVVVKRISNSRKAQLALRRRRMDHNVKLVLSEPCGTR